MISRNLSKKQEIMILITGSVMFSLKCASCSFKNHASICP